jgi:hypothetical protein
MLLVYSQQRIYSCFVKSYYNLPINFGLRNALLPTFAHHFIGCFLVCCNIYFAVLNTIFLQMPFNCCAP